MKVIKEDYSYLWEELEDLDKLRQVFLLIVRLFFEEHKNLGDLNQIDKEKFKKAFRQLISDPNALLQKTRKSQIKEIEGLGIEQWFKRFWKDIMAIDDIIKKYEKLTPFEKKFRYMKFDGLNWKIPRTTLDFLIGHIQLFSQTGSSDFRQVLWSNILNKEERFVFEKNQEQQSSAFYNKNKPTLQERLASMLSNYKDMRLKQKAEVSGQVFGSTALRKNIELLTKEAYQARISFSVFLPKIDEFLDFMMHELVYGVLSGIPVAFKILQGLMPHNQGNGDNAHIYFGASYEKQLYNALTNLIYPELERRGRIALGGRFLMIPVMNEQGVVLKGVEFGQDFYEKSGFKERNRIIQEETTYGGLSTNEFIETFSCQAIKLMKTKELLLFKNIYLKGGNESLRRDADFLTYYKKVRIMLLQWHRNQDYPILDEGGTIYFPNFTRTIQKYKPKGI